MVALPASAPNEALHSHAPLVKWFQTEKEQSDRQRSICRPGALAVFLRITINLTDARGRGRIDLR